MCTSVHVHVHLSISTCQSSFKDGSSTLYMYMYMLLVCSSWSNHVYLFSFSVRPCVRPLNGLNGLPVAGRAGRVTVIVKQSISLSAPVTLTSALIIGWRRRRVTYLVCLIPASMEDQVGPCILRIMYLCLFILHVLT